MGVEWTVGVFLKGTPLPSFDCPSSLVSKGKPLPLSRGQAAPEQYRKGPHKNSSFFVD